MRTKWIDLGLVLLTLVIARFLMVGLYVHPMADDWFFAVAAMEDPSFDRVLFEYQRWNGRLFSSLLALRIPLMMGLEQGLIIYRALSIGLILLSFAGIYSVISALYSTLFERRSRMLLTALLLVLFLHMMPDLFEGIYWYTGWVTYHLPSILLLFLVSSWIMLSREQHTGRRIALHTCNVVLTIMIASSSEIHMLLAILFYSTLLASTGFIRKRIQFDMVGYLALALVCGAVMMLAPGNDVRAEYFEHGHQVLPTITGALSDTFRHLADWTTEPVFLLATGIWIVLHLKRPQRSTTLVRPWIIATGTFLIVLLLVALPYWAMGVAGPGRTLNVIFMVFLGGWFMFITTLFNSRWSSWGLRIHPAVLPVLLVAFFGATTFRSNAHDLTMDLFDGTLAEYDRQMEERYQLVRDAIASGQTDVVVPPATKPKSLNIFDGVPDPDNWVNREFVAYFGSREMDMSVMDVPD